MIEALIVIGAAAALIALSLRANVRFRHEDRLPMQWSLNHEVNWTAPRALALAFTPALAICSLFAAGIAMLLMKPRPGQEGLEVPVLLMISFGFIAVHLLHLWMIDRSLSGRGG